MYYFCWTVKYNPVIWKTSLWLQYPTQKSYLPIKSQFVIYVFVIFNKKFIILLIILFLLFSQINQINSLSIHLFYSEYGNHIKSLLFYLNYLKLPDKQLALLYTIIYFSHSYNLF